MDKFKSARRKIAVLVAADPMAVFLGLLIGGKLFGLLGIILAIPVVAIGKVFFKFLRELYMASHFYHAGEYEHPTDAPSKNIEERIADAADAVLAEQVDEDIEDAENGGEDLKVDESHPYKEGA